MTTDVLNKGGAAARMAVIAMLWLALQAQVMGYAATQPNVGANMSTSLSEPVSRMYEIWEPEPAPNRGSDYSIVKARGYPYDKDWEEWSYPLGNGYIGANLFGRTDTERIQITDKTVHVRSPYGSGGLTSFAELYLDFGHTNVTGYRRALNLNSAIANVVYESGGVRYTREYLTSYPDKVLVIRLSADRPRALSFKIRAEIPYLESREEGDCRSGQRVIGEDLISLSGTTAFLHCNYEGQLKVLNEGGLLSRDETGLTVSGADAVTLLFATGTNYRLGPHIFLNSPEKKLDPDLLPHKEVSETIRLAVQKGHAALKEDHLRDYQHLFGRVVINLCSRTCPLPTSRLLAQYKAGQHDTYLEELMFQYGRYLLIASSREETLPANLQGTWSQYEVTPWSGGYWHNINVQMNYWGAMSANLAETFEAYINYFEAYLPKAREHADRYVENQNPGNLSEEKGDNGWAIGTGCNSYHIGGVGGHSGPGTGGFTSKMLMEYYQFTRDEEFLRTTAYPALRGMSLFFSKALHPAGDGRLLINPSASPEQRHDGNYYITEGCTFDQGFVWENHSDVLKAASILGLDDPFLADIREQLTRLDPILIGGSGQIKEFREEDAYGEIGEEHHRHISHLCPLYPGTLINWSNPAWMAAASRTLDLRGDMTTGWAMAHRMICRARLGEGEQAHRLYEGFIANKTVPNLWTLHPPFQIDGNLGTMAGVVEMLLQSHEGCIALLPALPNAWPNGMFQGLVARGNFVLSAEWQDCRASAFTVLSRSGGICRLKSPALAHAVVKDRTGTVVDCSRERPDVLTFSSEKGMLYRIELKEVM